MTNPVYPYPATGSLNPRPGLVQAIGIMTLINGILNILWGIGLTATVVLSTLFFGILCAPLTILPTILGVFEILYAVKLMAYPPQRVRPANAIAILEICAILFGNVPSLIVGILALVFYNDQNVQQYFARINNPV